MENSPKVFTFYVKTAFAFFILNSSFLIEAASASPFAVSAARDAFDGQPAVRVSFDFPADHHLYSSFSVATPAGDALAPLSVPAPDVNDPNDIEPSYSKSFAAYYAPPAADAIVVAYQGCAGTVCFMPETVVLSLDDDAAPESAPAAAPAATAPALEPAQLAAAQRVLQAQRALALRVFAH